MLIKQSEMFSAQCRTTLNAAIVERDQITARLKAIDEEKAQLGQRLIWLATTIEALKPLAEAEGEAEQAPQIGVVCYNTLLNLQRPATAPELRLLVAPYVDMRRHKNPLAVIHMALKRMNDVTCFKGTDGKVYYQAAPAQAPLVMGR